MTQWTKTPPSEPGWYWWRGNERELSIVCIERNNHKPPWWMMWWVCDGSPDDGCPMCAPPDLNFDGTGPCELARREGVIFAGGEWWPEPIEPPE